MMERGKGNSPTRGSPCCPQWDEQVTHLKIGANETVVGLLRLGQVFQELARSEFSPTDRQTPGASSPSGRELGYATGSVPLSRIACYEVEQSR